MKWSTLIATGLGVGYFPFFPGTIGSLFALLLFLLLQHLPTAIFMLFLLLLFGLGVYSSYLYEASFKKKDASEIVIDEIVAMLIVLFFLPASVIWWIAGFLSFRLFDITKPPPIRIFERLPGGWGVMVDDLIAAGYALGILHLARWMINDVGNPFG
ncbi:MAG: phosphatidylglycerophosphatase A [Nitrospira sp.]|nr:phosphatidylglycerophosphatase A [Candidatus Manganitrophaceae bacterium]HIL35433.1 phosphatidylglycerophosphatase A [Candidatus Manganitrophaceae bacterium]